MKKSFLLAIFFLDNCRWATRKLKCAPRVGDEVRFSCEDGDRFFTVNRICWPMDEKRVDGLQRINIRIEESPDD